MPDPLRYWKQDVLETAADRFARRLTEETGAIRLEMAGLRTDMARIEARLVRWMFAFWIGQLGVTLTVVGFVLHAVHLL